MHPCQGRETLSWGRILTGPGCGSGHVPQNCPCGGYCVAAKGKLVEILCFQYLARHVVFGAEGDKFRNKRIEDNLIVTAVIIG